MKTGVEIVSYIRGLFVLFLLMTYRDKTVTIPMKAGRGVSLKADLTLGTN